MSGISKRVIRCLSNGNFVLSSVKKHREKIALALVESMEGMTLHKAQDLLQTLIDYLSKHNQDLGAREQIYATEQADDPKYMEARDRSIQALLTPLRQVRRFIKDHAPSRLRGYGLGAKIPRAGDNLQKYAEHAVHLLSVDHTPVESMLFGMSVVPSAAAETLKPLLQAFSIALKGVQEETRDLEETLIERDRALDAWRTAYQSVSNIFAGFYQIAGEPELARRIRPTNRKVNGDAQFEAVETENDVSAEDPPTSA